MALKNDDLQNKMTARAISLEDLGLDNQLKVQLSAESFSQYIRVLQQNWRQGTVASKTRGETSFSNRKPWKQKGTGRARAGSLRSPLWRKGGVVFGPQPRVKTMHIPKSVKKSVMAGLLNTYIEQNKVLSIDWDMQIDKPKTSAAYTLLYQAGLSDKKVLLFVSIDDQLIHASFSNLPNVRMVLFDQVNAYDLAYSDYWLVLEKDKQSFNEMVSTWI